MGGSSEFSIYSVANMTQWFTWP